MRRLKRLFLALGRLFSGGDRAIAAVAVLLFVYYCVTKGIYQGKASGDGYLGFLYLPGLLFHHSFDLAAVAPEYAGILGKEVTGRVANPCPIGPILVWAPTYLLGLALRALFTGIESLHVLPLFLQRALLPVFPLGVPLSAHGPLDYWMAGLGALGTGLFGNVLLFKLLRRRLDVPAARFGVLGGVLATPLTWYLVTQPMYQHSTSFFALALFVERWDAWRAQMTLRRWAALGALAGFLMLVRLQEAIWLLLPGLDLLGAALRSWRRPRELGRVLLCGAVLGCTAALCFAPQVAVWWSYYGQLRAPQAPGHMRWTSPALVETLFSTRAGLFPWIPALYLALPGLWLGRRHLKGLAGRLALMLAIELWVNASAWDYHASWAYGPRRFTDAALVFAAGLSGLWAHAGDLQPRLRRGWRRALAVVLALLIAWNFLLMELSRQRKVKSASAGAYPASTWVRWAKGPEWLALLFQRTGYLFVQPAAWIYGLVYRMPSTSFEGIVGNYLLERDWRIRGWILNPGFAFAEAPAYVVEGVAPPPPGGWPAGAPVPARATVRLIIPLSAREPVRLRLSGDFRGGEGQVTLAWNGVPIERRPAAPGLVAAEVPERLTHSRGRLNELVISGLREGTTLRRLDFQSFTEWWRR